MPATECTAAISVITHTPTGRTLRYGEVAAEAAKLPVPTDVKVKTPAEWKIIGKGVKRLDTETSCPASRSSPSTCSCPTC